MKCGHCKNEGVTVEHVRACSAPRKAERPSTSGARSTRRTKRPALVYPNNPFFQNHLDAELAYSMGGMYNRRQLTQIVIGEFLRSGYADEASECGHCHTMNAWWRPTVGSTQCIACGSVLCPGRAHWDKETGKVIEDTPTVWSNPSR